MIGPRTVLLAVGALAIGTGLAAGSRALYKAGWNAREVQAVREERLIELAALKAQEAAAEAIAGIKVRHVTIRQELEKEIRENVVYRDCAASDRVFQLSNEAITGKPFKRTDDSGVSGTAGPDRPDL